MDEYKLSQFARRNLHIRDLERHANDERKVGKIHIVGEPATREIKPTRVLLRPSWAIRIAVIGMRVTKTENGVDQ